MENRFGPGVRSYRDRMSLREELESATRRHPTRLELLAEQLGASASRGARPPEELLLSEGEGFYCPGVPASREETPELDLDSARLAVEMALNHPDELRVVHGLARSSSDQRPTARAWCVDAEGRVVDPVWPGAREYLGLVAHPLEAALQIERSVRCGAPPLLFLDPEYRTRPRHELLAEALRLAG